MQELLNQKLQQLTEIGFSTSPCHSHDMKKFIKRGCIWVMLIFYYNGIRAQELFVFSEPASNMPAKSLGIRASNWLMYDNASSTFNYQLIPELMWGINKNLMVHLDGFFTNQGGNFHAVGAGTYAKYRIYTADDVNRHFRLAAYGRLSLNNSAIFQQEIDLTRNNTGYALGLIATQLLHRQALSATIGFNQAYNNGPENKLPPGQADQAINFSLATGRLIFPREYISFKQTNLNLMLELLGQHLIGEDENFIDLAPGVQFIFNSQTRLDIGYKVQLYSNMQRVAPNGFMIRVEHLLFNVF
jgi:hypothetical protein